MPDTIPDPHLLQLVDLDSYEKDPKNSNGIPVYSGQVVEEEVMGQGGVLLLQVHQLTACLLLLVQANNQNLHRAIFNVILVYNCTENSDIFTITPNNLLKAHQLPSARLSAALGPVLFVSILVYNCTESAES